MELYCWVVFKIINMICIRVVNNSGYGVDYGCITNPLDFFQKFYCSSKDFGKELYRILNHPPYQDCSVYIIDY